METKLWRHQPEDVMASLGLASPTQDLRVTSLFLTERVVVSLSPGILPSQIFCVIIEVG